MQTPALIHGRGRWGRTVKGLFRITGFELAGSRSNPFNSMRIHCMISDILQYVSYFMTFNRYHAINGIIQYSGLISIKMPYITISSLYDIQLYDYNIGVGYLYCKFIHKRDEDANCFPTLHRTITANLHSKELWYL